MEHTFWHQKWENNQIAFHEDDTNPFLLKYIHNLPVDLDSRIFVPLCGKTRDIAWLLSKGYKVIGVELVEMAVQQLFEELGETPDIIESEDFKLYRIHNLEVFVGDFFNLSAERLGPVNAIYDRAAFVALPEAMRQQYTLHLATITDNATQLLITYEYDTSLMSGPPFSTSQQEVTSHYDQHYNVKLLSNEAVEGNLKGHPAIEYVWLLKRKNSLQQ